MNQVHFLTAAILIQTCSECDSRDATPSRDVEMVCVDSEILAAVVARKSESVPTVNPATGQRFLMPGLYCLKRKEWNPASSPEQINRQPGPALCPKTTTPLAADGRWPEDKAVKGDDE